MKLKGVGRGCSRAGGGVGGVKKHNHTKNIKVIQFLEEMTEKDFKEKENDFTVEERIPCPDDLCVGIIGEDGVCGICGRKLSSDATQAAEIQEIKINKINENKEEHLHAGENERIPCPDDLCTGIIGEDGRCGVCGKKA